ncbi:MAG TPA: hypothetical protein DDW52_18975, partial [Planctomycetaceae bacterium]|nr:hypothetical protein [Planctomycetaceae bacterium]
GNGLRRPQAGEPGTVMVMHELENPRDTYLLNRGQYDAPDKSNKLSPGVPAAIDFSTDSPRNRLELAQWLVDSRNPLTARVAVNRIWQQFFGRGLVESSDNLGSQGSVPTHPQLLDWLASELIESGWDIQHIQRLIAGSATFAQSSSPKKFTGPDESEPDESGPDKSGPEKAKQTTAEILDPQNVWFSRGPRVRFSAPIVRDAALVSSGLLVERFGGPSVKPYMPPKVWSSMSNNKYVQDSGGALFRRSLYTYWRRTIPPPTMVAFNAAGREVCSVKTEVTNTPLQALTLLNNKLFVEAARNMAQRSMRTHKQTESRLVFAFRQILSRDPKQAELKLLKSSLAIARQHFEGDSDATHQLLSVGESEVDAGLPKTEIAAMTVVANLLYNLDEAIYRD